MTLLQLITDDRFGKHRTPPGHPESAERADVMQAVAEAWRQRGGRAIAPRPASREELVRVHRPAYLDAIAATSGRAVALDPDTFTSPDSYEVARLAAGAAVTGVESVLDADGPRRAFAFVRPPGHHAEAGRAMGFCLLNNAAVAAAHALAKGLQRVAIVDYDVHHGNGTQWTFYDDPRVLYVSTHQFPYYPGTGAATDVGSGDGAGFTLNVPLEAGATDADYALVFAALVVPVVRQFLPQLLIVSAGFDAHEHDPLAGMQMSTQGFAWLNAELLRAAAECCDGRMVLVTEGGYDLRALSECLRVTAEVLDRPNIATPEQPTGDTARGRDAVRAVARVQRQYWQL